MQTGLAIIISAHAVCSPDDAMPRLCKEPKCKKQIAMGRIFCANHDRQVLVDDDTDEDMDEDAEEVRKLMDKLLEECEVFTTIDDNNFLTTLSFDPNVGSADNASADSRRPTATPTDPNDPDHEIGLSAPGTVRHQLLAQQIAVCAALGPPPTNYLRLPKGAWTSGPRCKKHLLCR